MGICMGLIKSDTAQKGGAEEEEKADQGSLKSAPCMRFANWKHTRESADLGWP